MPYPCRRIKIGPNEMTLLSGLSTYGYKRCRGERLTEILEILEKFEKTGVISKEVYLVGKCIMTCEIPEDLDENIAETARYYFEVGEDYLP